MNFADDQIRHDFHLNSTLLQVVCQLLESNLYGYAYQLTVFATETSPDIHMAMLNVEAGLGGKEELDTGFVTAAVERTNAMFKRTDGKATVKPEIEDYSILSVTVTSSKDFACLN